MIFKIPTISRSPMYQNCLCKSSAKIYKYIIFVFMKKSEKNVISFEKKEECWKIWKHSLRLSNQTGTAIFWWSEWVPVSHSWCIVVRTVCQIQCWGIQSRLSLSNCPQTCLLDKWAELVKREIKKWNELKALFVKLKKRGHVILRNNETLGAISGFNSAKK